MVLGKYGTLVWIDAQLDTGEEGDASEHGQRIAGSWLPSSSKEVKSKLSLFALKEERDVWSCLALDEESGRVVVGSVDGTFTIFDYSPSTPTLDLLRH